MWGSCQQQRLYVKPEALMLRLPLANFLWQEQWKYPTVQTVGILACHRPLCNIVRGSLINIVGIYFWSGTYYQNHSLITQGTGKGTKQGPTMPKHTRPNRRRSVQHSQVVLAVRQSQTVLAAFVGMRSCFNLCIACVLRFPLDGVFLSRRHLGSARVLFSDRPVW